MLDMNIRVRAINVSRHSACTWFKPISQLRFDYDMTTIRPYHDAFDYDESDRNHGMYSIQLRYDYDTTTMKDEKLTCSFFACIEWKQAHMIRRSRIVVISQSNHNCNHGISYKPGSRLLLIATRWEVTFLGNATPASFTRYQIILLGDRGTCVWTICPQLLHNSRTAFSWTPPLINVWCPNHYTTKTQACTQLTHVS